MKLSLNSARLGNDRLSFVEFVELAARHGFDGVDFGVGAAQQAAAELGGADALKKFLEEKGVAPATFGLEVEWRKDEETFQNGLAALPEKAAFAASIGSERCCTWILPATNDDPNEWRERTIKRFTAIAEAFAEHGIRFGLEWVGPHHLRAGGANATGSNNVVHTMPQTLEMIAAIGKANVGLLVDSYHCYATGVTEGDLATLNDTRIVHVHINDAPEGVGPEGTKDGERVLPGEGEIDLSAFLSGLKRAGYTGYIAAEILAPQALAETSEEGAAKVRESLRKLGL